MKEDSQKLKIHSRIFLITFLGLFLIRFIFAKIPINYGYGGVTLGSLFLLLFGFYLIFVSSLYFRNVFYTWKNNKPWEKDAINSCLLLLSFSVSIVFLVLSEGKPGPMALFHEIIKDPSFFFFRSLPGWVFMIGFSIVFPISLYTSFLSIKSLITAKKEKKAYYFGITFLILSMILLTASYYSFFLIANFWIHGGTNFI